MDKLDIIIHIFKLLLHFDQWFSLIFLQCFYPLFPLLFLLVIEGLSRLIGDAKLKGNICGIKLMPTVSFTHLLFVYDVVLFGCGTIMEWQAYKYILDLFCAASGMCISLEIIFSKLLWRKIIFSP